MIKSIEYGVKARKVFGSDFNVKLFLQSAITGTRKTYGTCETLATFMPVSLIRYWESHVKHLGLPKAEDQRARALHLQNILLGKLAEADEHTEEESEEEK